jgi:hypothetical protein
MQRVLIRLGVHRDSLNAELVTRPNDAKRYLAPIGYQNFLEWHRAH